MRTNLYHLLGFLPATERWEMPPALEALAQQLVRSGKLRISADYARNFVRHGEVSFTVRELHDPALAAATRARLARLVAPAAGEAGLLALSDQLRLGLRKAGGVSAEKEARVARVLVQSAHPAVIQLLLQSGTELFISYDHNVAELMQMHEWETHGTSSGLQATDLRGTAVYVSAGGDPFFEGEQKTYVTDGFPSLARMVVIAGQELGHFADLRRSARGIIGRHSTDRNASQLRADPVAAAARRADMRTTTQLGYAYAACGLGFLRKAEKNVAFYHTRRRYSPPWLFYQLWRLVAWGWLMLQASRRGLPVRFAVRPRLRKGEAISAFLGDMAFNLAPEADAYRDPDPLVEEAITVIEAVARVPQQVHKWGARAVACAWPQLFSFYEGTVIPACMAAVENPLVPQRLSPVRRLCISLRRGLRAKPGYYP